MGVAMNAPPYLEIIITGSFYNEHPTSNIERPTSNNEFFLLFLLNKQIEASGS